jgi:hypothetical protein
MEKRGTLVMPSCVKALAAWAPDRALSSLAFKRSISLLLNDIQRCPIGLNGPYRLEAGDSTASTACLWMTSRRDTVRSTTSRCCRRKWVCDRNRKRLHQSAGWAPFRGTAPSPVGSASRGARLVEETCRAGQRRGLELQVTSASRLNNSLTERSLMRYQVLFVFQLREKWSRRAVCSS